MKRVIRSWWSPALHKDMQIVVYGHYGPAVLLFPTAAADFLEYERFQLIDSIAPLIGGGKFKVYSINSINAESWLNRGMQARHKAIRHQQYNRYVTDEVVPFIRTDCGGDVPITTSGASLGALHALNSLFRRPDLFAGTIAMSGVYDLKTYSDGYYDEDVYFNSPTDYVANLDDHGTLEKLRRKDILIASGSGAYESPQAARRFSEILRAKSIPHDLQIWGGDMTHDWPTWRRMLPHFLGQRAG